MRKLQLVIAMAVLMLAMVCSASFAFTGSLTSGNGLTGTGEWANGSTLSWTVVQNGAGTWDYSYELSVQTKDISHILIEVSDNFTVENVLQADGTWELNTYTSTSEGVSEIGLPDDIYALKFETASSGTGTDWIVNFTSDRAPVWGDFYAQDGKNADTKEPVFVYNTSFTDPDPTDPPSDGSIDGKILRPDSVVPEPSSILLFASGLSAVGVFFRRKR